MHYLTIGTLWKNEHSYAEDFIKYHRKVGVQKFVIFDREYFQTKKMFENDLDVEVIHFPEMEGNTHQEAWGQLIKHNQGKTNWLSLLDADQCLVPVQTDDVKQILRDYEEFACLQVNWKSFGSGGQDQRLPGSVYERFTLTCLNDCEYNYHTQFICQPDRVLPIKTEEPHYCLLPDGEISVNTDKEEITVNKVVSLNPNTPLSFNSPPLHNILYVNHYTNKSKEEFLFKRNKGRADIPGCFQPLNQFEEYESLCNKIIDKRAYEIWQKETLK